MDSFRETLPWHPLDHISDTSSREHLDASESEASTDDSNQDSSDAASDPDPWASSSSNDDDDDDNWDDETWADNVDAARDAVLHAALVIQTAWVGRLVDDWSPTDYYNRGLLRGFSTHLARYEGLRPAPPRLARDVVAVAQDSRAHLRQEWFREKRALTQAFARKRMAAQRQVVEDVERATEASLQALDDENRRAGRGPRPQQRQHQQHQQQGRQGRRQRQQRQAWGALWGRVCVALRRLWCGVGPPSSSAKYLYVSEEEASVVRVSQARMMTARLSVRMARVKDEEWTALCEMATLYARYLYVHLAPEDRVPQLLEDLGEALKVMV